MAILRVWRKIVLSAPSQIANALGFFDRCGMLGRDPPQDDHSCIGGPGDVLTVERISDGKGITRIEYLRRGCDKDGSWQDVEQFFELSESVRANPGQEIVQVLTERTLMAIRELPSGHNLIDSNDSLQIQVLKYLPNRKVGLGIGSSASSAAVVLAIDKLFGEPLHEQEKEVLATTGVNPLLRLHLMAEGERIASGKAFYDNVAPLVVRGGLIYIDHSFEEPRSFKSLPWPEGLYFVTITPDFCLETRRMREILINKRIDIVRASSAAQRRVEVMRGLYTNDLERVIQHAGDDIIEPVRWPLIDKSGKLRKHVVLRRQQGMQVSIGISGSGPSVYCLADSYQTADRIGNEIHDIWYKQGIASWWFVHEINRQGARVIHQS